MHDPLWTATADVPRHAPLTDDTTCDVCVVGAGVAGVSMAYRLVRDGLDVVLVDRAHVAAGTTHHTTAHLASAQDDRLFHIAEQHGEEGARIAARSHAAAIDWIERIARDEEIACGFRRLTGYLFLGPNDGPELLDRELEASRRAGLDVERLERAPLSSYDTGPCLAFADQAAFHPVRFVAGLAHAIERHGGRIFGWTRVTDVENSRGAGPRRLATATVMDDEPRTGPAITADHVVLATNSPTGHYLTSMKMVPYRTFATSLRLTGDVPDALYWDTADPYHYIRLSEDEEGPLLIVGGGDYQSGTRDRGEERQKQLEQWARERFPVGDVAYAWSGQVLEPADSMAFIGRAETESRVYVVTGDSGQGITHGVIGALLIGDLVQGRDNPWEPLYSPLRVTPRAATEYARDAVRIGTGFAEWLSTGDVESAAEVERGQGAIVRDGLVPTAVFRDDDGAVHRLSAVCPHLGCIVQWNSTATEWDCPCHGSRFGPTGELLNGPATEGLEDAS